MEEDAQGGEREEVLVDDVAEDDGVEEYEDDVIVNKTLGRALDPLANGAW